MDLHDEHASFLSTIAFSSSSPYESMLTLTEPGRHHSTTTLSPRLAEKPPGSRSSVNSSSSSRGESTKYGLISNSAQHARHSQRKWITDSWLLELGGLFLALLSMGALIVTLLLYQNKGVPQWGWGLTLNSLLSILSQITTVSITMVLAEALSQQKWLWFRKSARSLADFGRFDEASKGPWGSLVLLCSKSRLL